MSLEKLRALPEFQNASDAEIIGVLAKTSNLPLSQVASAFGVDEGSKWGNRLGASVDSYQAGMYGVAEAVTGADWARRGRERNEAESNLQRQFAADQGAISSYKDVGSFGDAADYVGGLAVDSLPYLAEAAVGGLAGRAILGPAQLALRANPAARGVLGLTRSGASTAGAIGASYPSAVGDILQNQREAGNGETDLGMAALGGVPYAALNAFGLEGAAARGSLTRAGIQALDDMTGLRGGLARTGVAFGKNALQEGASETGQEVVNQYFGRMATDPNATLLDPDAIERYKESFVGGAALGGTVSSAMGGWRRSEGYLPPGRTVDDGSTDLLNTWTTSQGFEDVAGQRPLADPRGSVSSPLGDLTPDWETSRGFEDVQSPRGLNPQFRSDFIGPVAPGVSPGQAIVRQGEPIDALDLYPQVGDDPLVRDGYSTPREERISPQPDMPAVDLVPETMPVDFMGTVAGTDQQVEQMNDPGAVIARQQWMAQQQRVAEQNRIAAETKQRIEGQRKRAAEVGLKGDKAAEVLSRLDDALKTGLITDSQFGENLGMLQARQMGAVSRFLDGIAAQKQAVAQDNVQQKQDAMTALQRKVGSGKNNPAPAGAPVAAVPQAATAALQAAAQPAPAAVPAPAGPGSAAASAPGGQPAQPATVTVGRAGREKQVSMDGLRQMLTVMPAVDRARVLDAMGMEETTDPDTGAPITVQTSNPRTFEEVAVREAARTGKKVSRQAIQNSLAKYGVTEEVINRVVGTQAQAVTANELGIDPAEDGSGFRVEEALSKAAGQGLVDDGTAPTGKRAKLVEQADTMLGNERTLEEAPVNDDYAEKRRVAAAAAVERDLARRMADPEAQLAITDWNDSRFDAAPEFDELTTAEKLEYLDEYRKQTDDTGNEWDPLEALVQRLSREAMGARDRASFAGADGRPAAVRGVGAQPRGNRVGQTDAGDTSRVQSGPQKLSTGQVAWDALAKSFPFMPAWDTLTERQHKQVQDLVDREQFNLAAANTVAGAASKTNEDVLGPDVPLNRDVLGFDDATQTKADRVDAGDAAVSGRAGTTSGRESAAPGGRKGRSEGSSTVAQVVEELKAFLRRDALGTRVVVVATAADLPAGVTVSSKTGTRGVAIDDRRGNRVAYLIAGNLPAGKIRSVFMHEVGSHLGLDNLLTKPLYDKLVEQVKAWAQAGASGSTAQEHILALKAAQRVQDAQVKPGDRRSELLAYFVEEAVEAGIDPTLTRARKSTLEVFIGKVMGAFVRALTRLGTLAGKITAQDIVDLAYGAAQIEMGYSKPVVVAGDVRASRSGFSDAFRRWFGNSKVVDAAGQPLVVYHGTTASFSKFEKSVAGELGAGFYFTPDSGSAEAWGRRSTWGMTDDGYMGYTNDGLNVMPVYVSIQNPAGTKDVAAVKRALGADWTPSAVTAELRERGFDGVWSKDDGEIVAFYPEQIKSATGNNGNYDPSNPSILESRSDQLVLPKINRATDAIGSFTQAVKDGASWLGLRTMFTEDLVNLASKLIPSARKYKAEMDKIEVVRGKFERRVAAILQDFRKLSQPLQGVGGVSVNQLLMDSTMKRAWAYKPAWMPEAKVDPELAARFNAMPEAARDVIRRVFEHGHETLLEMKASALANISSEYDSAIAAAKEVGDATEVAKLEAQKAKSSKEFSSLFDMSGAWPYAPLRRFGNYVVQGVSQAYLDAEQAGDTAKMQELEKDGAHYFVAFTDTRREARAMQEQIKGQYADTAHFERLNLADAWVGGRDMLSSFQRLRTLVKDAADADADLSKAANKNLDNMMRQLYLTLLSETSARKSEMNRRNIAGADGDMMRAFATQGRATAHFIAGLKTNGAVTEHLQAMHREVRERRADRDQKQAYYNEIMRRHAMTLEFTPSGVIEKAMAGTSVWMLLTNPSYYLVNAVQPWLMTQPLMAAKHGYAKSAAELGKAYRELVPVLKDGSFGEDDYRKLPADVRQAVEDLANQGVIDISLESVLGTFESASDSPTRHVEAVTQKMRTVAQTVEAMNRLSTAMAAYRMEKERTGSHEDGVKYAARVIYETHGDYSGFNAPRFMRRGIGKLATQFRKFQLIQLSMYARLFQAAFGKASAEEKMVARKALAFNFGHMFAAGGLMGMPGFAAVAWLVGAALGDDEPDDPEATLRRAIGDKDLADLLLKGAPKLAGVDISGRVGAGGMLSILPYTDIEVSREGYAQVVTGLAGPFVGGLLPRTVDGIGYIAGGEYWKGLEQLMPSLLSNAMKGIRFSTEGVTQRNGDVVMSGEEIVFMQGLMQAIGLPTNAIKDRSFVASAKFKADAHFRERTSELKRMYAQAVRDGDEAARREAIAEWQSTQEARRRLGYDTQPMSELLRAPMEQRKRERETLAGVQVRDSNRGFVAQLTQ